MNDEKLTVQATQQVAWQLAETLRSGTVQVGDHVLSTKFQRAAVHLLEQIAAAEPKLLHQLFDRPIPKESGQRAARKSGALQGLAYELSKSGKTIEQVAEELGVERDAANTLINAGSDVFHQRMQRNKAKTTDE